MKILLTVSLLVLLCLGPAEAKDAACGTLKYQQGKLYAVTTRLHHSTHIQLPENLLTEPIIGNSDLWDMQGVPGSNHIFVKPNSGEEQGQSTTLTAISDSNTAYTFLLNRVDGHSDYCLTITRSGPFYSEEKPFKNYLSQAEKQALLLAKENTELRSGIAASNETVDSRVEAAIKKYQSTIYTNYSWKSFGRSKLTNGLVTDVMDDGRYTSVRLRGVPFGTPVFVAEIEGEETIVEGTFDSTFNTYKIAGIYSELVMKFDKRSGVRIKRGDFQTRSYVANSKKGSK